MKRKPIQELNLQRLKRISIYLKEIRFNLGLTQEMVCEEIDLHPNSLVRMENSKNFTILSLFELAEYYDIPISEIFFDIG